MDNPTMEWIDSEVMMPMITSWITPEEAEFLMADKQAAKEKQA